MHNLRRACDHYDLSYDENIVNISVELKIKNQAKRFVLKV